MSTLKNDNLIRALLKQPVDRTPVWMMRQAGRYLPEYLALRQAQPNFVEFCQTPELCCEATLQPLERFDLDAAIIFSDILTVPHAMGMDLHFHKGRGPVFSSPIFSVTDVNSLSIADAHTLQYVMDAISTTKKALSARVPLIGFAGSPWTIACYMVEGAGSKAWVKIKSMLYSSPDIVHALLKKLTTSIISYLNGQIEAGADVIMLFDSWGGALSYHAYPEFSLSYMQHIIQSLHQTYDGRRIPTIVFTKQGGPWLEQIAASGCDAVALDGSQNIVDAKARIGHKVTLQGNLDPQVLFANQSTIEKEVNTIMRTFNGETGHVFNLGHGIDKDTPIAGVDHMLAAIRAYKKVSTK